jgi:cell division protein FtsB
VIDNISQDKKWGERLQTEIMKQKQTLSKQSTDVAILSEKIANLQTEKDVYREETKHLSALQYTDMTKYSIA